MTSIVDNDAFDEIIQRAVDNGVITMAVNVDDIEWAAGNAPAAFVGMGFVPAGYSLGEKMAEFFPAEGQIKAANPDREVEIECLDTGTDGAVVAERVGAYINAMPDTTAYFDMGLWHAYIAQVLADRGVEPG